MVKLANYERYSSRVNEFALYGSAAFPKAEWIPLGVFEAEDEYGEQEFNMTTPGFAKFVKLTILSHHGSEFYCTLSELKVYGTTVVEDMSITMASTEKVRVSSFGYFVRLLVLTLVCMELSCRGSLR